MRVRAFAFIIVLVAGVAGSAPAQAATRAYYIAAEEVLWNYAPTGTNVVTGRALPPATTATSGPICSRA